MPHDTASLFRAYDIRGHSPGELDAAFAERLGRVLVRHFGLRHVMVGRDMRRTSPELEAAIVKGVTESGADVTTIGLCSTPMFNVTLGLSKGRYDFGVMITASHNPAEYNGIKMADGKLVPIGSGSGMEAIRDLFLSKESFPDAKKKGKVREDPGPLEAYMDHVFSLIDTSGFRKMTIAVDGGNGMNGYLMPAFAKRLPNVRFLPLYWELDGRFPNHEANPLNVGTLKDLQSLVKKKKCDFGAAFDGDGDRIGFVDERGGVIDGSMLTALFGKELLRDNPGALILHDLRASWIAGEEIQKAGGRTDMTRVGHAFIKQQIRKQKGLFAGEISMHFYFGDLWGVESSDLCLLLMMKLVSESKTPLSGIWTPMKRYAYSGEINSDVKDKEAVIARITKTYKPRASSVSTIDGIRMEFGVAKDGTKGKDAWWFSVRPSNTEPLMRLIVEAVTPKLMEEKRDELLNLIRS